MTIDDDQPEWLDDYRRGIGEILAWAVPPDCDCIWECHPDSKGLFRMIARRRQCRLHGEHGLW